MEVDSLIILKKLREKCPILQAEFLRDCTSPRQKMAARKLIQRFKEHGYLESRRITGVPPQLLLEITDQGKSYLAEISGILATPPSNQGSLEVLPLDAEEIMELGAEISEIFVNFAQEFIGAVSSEAKQSLEGEIHKCLTRYLNQ